MSVKPTAVEQTAALKKRKLFYGWIIVAVMAAAGAVSMGMGTLNFGLFIKPMGDELGIGRSMFGWAQTARQVASSVTSPIVGRILDRFGARALLAFAAAVTAGALIGLAFVDYAWQMIFLFAMMGLVGMAGPGALVTSVPVAKWFVRERGKAIGIMTLGIPVGAAIFIPLTQVFINNFGWRDAWIILAVMGGGVIIPLSLLFVRREPEDMGLLPDGDSSPREARAGIAAPPPPPLEEQWTVQEALRHPAFWRLVFVFSIVMFATGTIGLHRIPQFMDRGLNPSLVSYATAMDAVLAGTSTFFMGMLVSRIHARFLGGAAFGLMAVAVFLTIKADTTFLMFLSMAIFGLGIGGNLFLTSYLWAEYFGRANVGAIRGLVMPITLTASGIGPPLAGYVRDYTGTYDSIWWVALGLMLTSGLVLASTSPPKKRAPRSPVAPAPQPQ
jgi:MFS family permease